MYLMCTPKPLCTPAHWRQRKTAKLTGDMRKELSRVNARGIPDAHCGFGFPQSAQKLLFVCRMSCWREEAMTE